MRINRILLTLTIAGFTGPFLNWAQGQQMEVPPLAGYPASSVGRIADVPATIGDAALLPRGELVAPDNRPEEFRNNTVDPARLMGKTISDDLGGSISDDKLQYTTPAQLSSAVTSEGGEASASDASVGSSPSDYVIASPTVTTRRLGAFQSRNEWWAETEALLWFARQNSTPPLAVTGPTGFPPTTVLAGGDQLTGGNLAPGMRANIGKWLNDEKTLGIGGRVFGLFDGDSSQTFSSDGSTFLGVPVFDVFSGTNQVLAVASDAGVLGRDSGSISVIDSLSFFSTEAYGRVLLASSGKSRSDLIGGYTFLRLDNGTTLQTVSVDGIDNSTVDGTVTTTIDSFGTKNTFHGGHIGLTNEIQSGFCTLSTLTKVALGNMSTTTNVFGLTTEDVPPPAPSFSSTDEGLFTGAQLTGSQTRDRFTFIPEIGAKLRLDLTQRLQFSVGYTLIVIPEVGVGADLIDTTIDSSGFFGLPQTPGGILRDQVTYIQGVDLGFVLTF